MGLLDSLKKIIVGEDDSAEADASTRPQGSKAPNAKGGANIEQALREVIAEQSDGQLTAEEIPSDEPLLEEGHLDSLSSVKVLMFIEEQYGVEIQESELTGRLETLDALVKHVAAESAQPESSDA
jgi:acyl carrier protein